VMRSPCAGAELDSPLWIIVPNKALSLTHTQAVLWTQGNFEVFPERNVERNWQKSVGLHRDTTSCKGLGSVSLKINTQHTQERWVCTVEPHLSCGDLTDFRQFSFPFLQSVMWTRKDLEISWSPY